MLTVSNFSDVDPSSAASNRWGTVLSAFLLICLLGLRDTCIQRAASSGGLLATSFGGLQHFEGPHILYDRPSSQFCVNFLSVFVLLFMLDVLAHILIFGSVQHLHASYISPLFPTAFPSFVFLFSLLMCTPMCYLFGGLFVSCYFLSSSRTIGFPLTSLPAASKIGAIDL
jgi:hypothetical protein